MEKGPRRASSSGLHRAFRDAVRAKVEGELERERSSAAARRERVLRALGPALARARNDGLCTSAWLFGSYAWGTPGERSDIDLLVDGCDDPERLASLVGQETGTEVHVVQTSSAPPSLRDRAIAEGEPV